MHKDDWKAIGLAIVAGFILAALLLDASGVVDVLGPDHNEIDTVCADKYGDGVTAMGWIDSQPPHAVCELENGTVKLIAMNDRPGK